MNMIPSISSFSLKFLFLTAALVIFTTIPVSCSAIFSLKFRYAGTNRSLNSLKTHDTNRLQMLSNVDFPLGGTGRPDSSGLYYAKIGIGTPPKSYYMQVDTGSDITWVNCIECTECPKRGYHGIELTLYNPKESRTAKMVSCDQPFCLEVNGGPFPVCKANYSCNYAEFYGDGSSSTGYFVKDVVQYDQVSGDLQTTTVNGSVSFGCSAGQYVDQGPPNSDDALDGILAFGRSNSSMISQLASSGQVKKMFAHCLDGENGGGIFAVGNIVKPRVNTTPLIQNEPHYNVNMTGVEVGNYSLIISSDLFEMGGKKGAIIDIGTTLAYLPEVIYEPLVIQILSQQPNLKLLTVQDQYTCFKFSDSVDDGFPPVTFYFENGLSMKVYPHEYFFPVDDLWCVGWQNSGMQARDKKNLTLLGDLVLSNKLVIYDLENQVIGWTEYNCSSSIQVKDEQTGTVHLVGAHFISSASTAPASFSLSYFDSHSSPPPFLLLKATSSDLRFPKMAANKWLVVLLALLMAAAAVVTAQTNSDDVKKVKKVKGKTVCTKGWECAEWSQNCCNETISDFFQTYQFENLFSKRNSPVAHAVGFWDYQSFILAAAQYEPSGFGTTGGKLMGMKEVAAFLGHVGAKTSCGYGVATGGPNAWGLCYNKEMSPSQSYCDETFKYTFPCTPGVEYFGRGALPIYWNYNYGAAGEALKQDLLNHPEYIEQNATLAFQAAVWRWMTPVKKGQPSAHQAFVGDWKPTKNDTLSKRVPGFGTTMNILYGDLTCGRGDVDEMNTIISHYLYYLDLMGVGREEAGPNEVLSCAEQKVFNPSGSSSL